MRSIGSILPLALLLSTAAAQDAPAVRGLVLDPSGRPTPGARVECAGRSTTTEADGAFSFPGVASCRAIVSAPGFETTRLELVSGRENRVDLAISAVAERVVVTAARRETELDRAGVAADVLTRADLERRQYPPVADLLRALPGIQVSRYGRPGSLTQVFTRGGQRTATLFLIDGVPVNDPGGELNLAGFSSAGLERIEVVRGPESALFGAEASSAVVQLFTRRGDSERRVPRGALSYERGSFGTDRWMADLAGGAGGRLDYSLGAEQFHTSGEFPNDYFRNTVGTANAGVRLSSATQVRGIVRAFDSALGAPNQVSYGIVDRDARETIRDTLAAFRVEDARGANFVQRFSFGYHRSRDLFEDRNLDGPFEVAGLIRETNGEVKRVYLERLLDPGALPGTIPPGTRIEQRSVTLFPFDPFLSLSSRKNFDYQGTLAHSGGGSSFGYEYERQAADITGRDVTRDNHGAFVHRDRVVAGRLFLSGGARLEHNSAYGTKFAPRAAASWRVAGERGAHSSTLVRASAGLGITEPSLLQNFARDPFFVGNPDLRPEKTTSFEGGLAQEWFSRRLRTEVSIFENRFHDLIVFVFLPFPEPSTWRNIEASRARGAEFSAQARPASWLLVSGHYTRLWTRISRSNSPNSLLTGVGHELVRRPGNSGAVTLALTPRRWSFQTGASFIGERQDTDNLFGVTRNPGYQNVYAAASFRLDRRVTPFVRADNLLNARYQEVLGYASLSRTIHGGVRLEW